MLGRERVDGDGLKNVPFPSLLVSFVPSPVPILRPSNSLSKRTKRRAGTRTRKNNDKTGQQVRSTEGRNVTSLNPRGRAEEPSKRDASKTNRRGRKERLNYSRCLNPGPSPTHRWGDTECCMLGKKEEGHACVPVGSFELVRRVRKPGSC